MVIFDSLSSNNIRPFLMNIFSEFTSGPFPRVLPSNNLKLTWPNYADWMQRNEADRKAQLGAQRHVNYIATHEALLPKINLSHCPTEAILNLVSPFHHVAWGLLSYSCLVSSQ